MDALLRRLLCCFGTRRRRQENPRQRYGCRCGGARDDDDTAEKKSFLRRATRPSGAERLDAPRPRRRRWWPRSRGGVNNRIFARSPPCGTTIVEPRHATAAAAAAVQAAGGAGHREFPGEHAAAATIQAHFRGHLGRQAFRALRSLVKLQAFARGAYVRKQANVAIRFMKVLVRLQVRVRSRQLLLSTPPR
ncbi:unnamed protein product [Urochloa decumbens]|uniref:Uncharacterized protein n=1 Tax=Urochloa decumbens TaxID=240449 RepID=A0ABC9D2T6_9POAL